MYLENNLKTTKFFLKGQMLSIAFRGLCSGETFCHTDALNALRWRGLLDNNLIALRNCWHNIMMGNIMELLLTTVRSSRRSCRGPYVSGVLRSNLNRRRLNSRGRSSQPRSSVNKFT